MVLTVVLVVAVRHQEVLEREGQEILHQQHHRKEATGELRKIQHLTLALAVVVAQMARVIMGLLLLVVMAAMDKHLLFLV